MTTQAIYQERRGELNQLVRGWDRRLRLQQVFTWLPRCLLPGLTIGLAIAILSRLRPLLLSGQILLATGILLALGFVAMLIAVWLWPRPNLAAARRFDILFGLQERVSTALELIDGRIHADEELVALQVDDAWQTARGVRASESLPLAWRWREWTGVLLVALVLALLLIIPNPQEEKIAQDSAQRAAIDAAAGQLRQITQDVAADAALEPEKRDQLLQALQTSTNVLQQENVTPEEAFASLSDAQSVLQEKAEDLNQQANGGQAGLQAASDALRNFQSSDQQPQDGSQGVANALNNMTQNMSGMTQKQQQAAASSLQQASQAMQQSNPDAAQAMQQASQSLQNGDSSSAQQSLGQASDSIQQAQQQQQSQQSSAQQLSQAAQSVQESANQVSQQSQQNQQNQTGQDGQNGQQGQQDNQGQNGQQGQQGQQNPQSGQPQSNQQNQQGQNGQQGQPGDQGQQGQPNQSSQQQGQPGDQGQSGQQGQAQDGQQGQSGSQPGNQGQPGQGSQAGQSGQQGQQGQNGQPSPGDGSQQDGSQSGSASGAGAGDGTGDAGQDGQGAPSQTGQMPQNNNPDGQGQGQYDPVYAPQRIDGQSANDQQVQLSGDASQSPVQEGDFSQNPNGNVNVPYDQVFSDYSDAANRALESDYIPLGLRDVVRDYFSSLEPGQNSSGAQGSSSQP